VKDIVTTFAKDDRIVGWDVWNEPNNGGGGNYKPTPDKNKYVALLLPRFFDLGAQRPDPAAHLGRVDRRSLGRSEQARRCREDPDSRVRRSQLPRLQLGGDVRETRAPDAELWPAGLVHRIYGARQRIDLRQSLPIGKKLNIAMYNWGFVDGKTQTRLPWDSWKKPYTYRGADDLVPRGVPYFDGKPYRQAETDLIKRWRCAEGRGAARG
jgi:hypothetical protein